jgi:hypothetical protein
MAPARTLELIRNLDRCRAELRRATIAAIDTPLESVADSSIHYATLYGRRNAT